MQVAKKILQIKYIFIKKLKKVKIKIEEILCELQKRYFKCTRHTKVKETGNPRNIYQNEIDINCFQHGIAIGDLKELSRRIL